jgi:hypothetical protein
MWELSWPLIIGLASTGILMALASSLIGMRQWVEITSWWLLYAAWITIVLLSDNGAPFRTILVSSVFAGVLHATTQSVLLDHYIKNNPWYSEQMDKSHASLRLQFITSGLLIGTGFGALVAGIAWGIHRI